jgi:hypothetical protein
MLEKMKSLPAEYVKYPLLAALLIIYCAILGLVAVLEKLELNADEAKTYWGYPSALLVILGCYVVIALSVLVFKKRS